MTIFVLGYPILPRSIRARNLVEDTLVLKVVIKCMRKIFFAIVNTEDLYKRLESIFDKLVKLFEDHGNLRLIFHQVNPTNLGMIINKCDKPSFASDGGNSRWTSNITMHKVKWL